MRNARIVTMCVNGPARPTESPEPDASVVPIDLAMNVRSERMSFGFWNTPAKSARILGIPDPSDAGDRNWPHDVEMTLSRTHQKSQTRKPANEFSPTASIKSRRHLNK